MRVTVWLAWCSPASGNAICDVAGTLDGALELIEREVRVFHYPSSDGPLRFELLEVPLMETASGSQVDGLAVESFYGDGRERFADPWFIVKRTLEVEPPAKDPNRVGGRTFRHGEAK